MGVSAAAAGSASNDSNTLDPFYGLSFKVGVAENKNVAYRSKMEDVHTYIANFAEQVDWGYFAIFDGHAGKETARWCGNNLHNLLESEIAQTCSNGDRRSKVLSGDIQQSFCEAFEKADELIEKECTGSSGCTAAVAVLVWERKEDTDIDEPMKSPGPEKESTPNAKQFEFIPTSNHKRVLYTSNVGDSRIVIYRDNKAYRLSYDHKATDLNEIARIRDTGGLILKSRVNGFLAVTRSLGDSYMKDLVVGRPFTTSLEISPTDEFIILACDGLWDVISDQKACEFVTECFKSSKDPQRAARLLCQLAMDEATTDNVTVMIVRFDEDVFQLGI
ncbi:Protein phosphatase 2C 1 [Scheffersomyces spartinae]|uniref:Protein phosphatase 2C 1 n=1 Tax=Scheffersomyces spartinae TaxID=45513 RepID=A0A9P8AKQ5_9ASCO|nr:Protein phosphatase 2C 1 [Scheffersomyces spartinae]KAG7196068.1 Protein phosphatase 2C 1 [Scheffersomyces spartinae]